jgi:hypothetical protein
MLAAAAGTLGATALGPSAEAIGLGAPILRRDAAAATATLGALMREAATGAVTWPEPAARAGESPFGRDSDRPRPAGFTAAECAGLPTDDLPPGDAGEAGEAA